MREKYILRAGEIRADPDAWVLGVYFTRSKKNRKWGTLTLGGPTRFMESMDEILTRYFGVAEGVESERVQERQPDKRRKRLVYDVGPLTRSAFRTGIRDMISVGISAARVSSTGRLLR